MKPNRRTFLGSAALAAAGAGAAPVSAQQPVSQTNVRLPGRTPHTRFAPNLEMWWTRLPFLQRLENSARLGYRAVEFWPWRGKDIPAIAETCQRLDLKVAQFSAWGFRPGLNDPRNHNHFVEEIEASCETVAPPELPAHVRGGRRRHPGLDPAAHARQHY